MRIAPAIVLLLVLAAPSGASAQGGAAASARPAAPADALGRSTPRGTLHGFMMAARQGQFDTASQFLQTTKRDDGLDLARRLYVVLDARLPAQQLSHLSDDPAGSRRNPLKPDQDVIGTIETAEGSLDIAVARVDAAGNQVWLFSRETLKAIPEVSDEVKLVSIDRFLPGILRLRISGIRLFEWLILFIATPLLYHGLGLIGLALAPLQAMWRRRRGLPPGPPQRLPGAVRLFVLAIATRILLSVLELPLIERVFWTMTARVLAMAAVVWAGLLLTAYAERVWARRASVVAAAEIVAMLRLGRRTVDGLLVLAGVLIVLSFFGIDPTAALAGLGIGGIAVALAAQKTLENVIGGVSIIFDGAVRVGDFVTIGASSGTVDSIGLRSTRLRTLDRTMLTVPNGVVASANVETTSMRDKFWFHHYVPLRFETTAAQLRFIIGDVRDRLRDDDHVDTGSIRVRVVRFGPSSIDVELSAYVFAPAWEQFLEVQENLLLDVLDIVDHRDAAIALPAQAVQITGSQAAEPAAAARTGSAERS